MTSLSAQQSREAPDDSCISFKRHQRHRFSRPHQYYQFHSADHSTISPLMFTQRGGVGSADCCNPDSGFLKAGGGDSFSDYDNVIPFVRLDRIVEDETDREDCSINNMHCENAGWRGSPEARAVDREMVTQDTSGDLHVGSCLSSQRGKDSPSCCSYHCHRVDVCENSLVNGKVTLRASTDNESGMGNALFTSHSDRVVNSSSSSGSTKMNKGKCTFAKSNSGTYTEVGNTTNASSARFGQEYPDIKCTQSSEMGLSSFTSDVFAKENDSDIQNQSVDLSTHYQGQYSTFTKAIVDEDFSKSRGTSYRSYEFINEEIPSVEEKSSSSNARECGSRPEASNARISSKSTREKDSLILSATKQHTRSRSSTEGCDKWEQTVSERKTYTKRKLSYDEDTYKETGNSGHVYVGNTPVIIITTSTPKKKPLKASTNTELPDSLGENTVASNLPLHNCEKTHGMNGDSKNDYNTQKSENPSLEYRDLNGRQEDETAVSAPVYGLTDPTPSSSSSNLEFIDKKKPKAAVSHGSATVVDQHPSCSENTTDLSKVTDGQNLSEHRTDLSKVTDGLNLSNKEPGMNCSYTTATTKATLIAVATTKEIMTFSASTTQARYSGPHTAEEFKLNSYIDRPQAKSNGKDTHQEAMGDSLGGYALPCDVRQEAAAVLSHVECTDVNITEFSIAREDNTDHTLRELHHGLVETDSMSLSEPQYTEISEAIEPKVNASRIGKLKVGSDSTHYKVLHMSDSSDRHTDASDADAIYAIPIPKSQRKTQQYSTSTSKPSVNSKHSLAQPDSPSKPARSPLGSPGSSVFEDTDTVCDTHGAGNKVRVTCQMKQATNTGRFDSDSSDYDYSNIPNFGSYEFFSLGRRPKRLRGNALRNSKEVSVSLEMLLKFRHESGADMSVSTADEQTVSVDDILRSCQEFEQSHVYYRDRACSDSLYKSNVCSLSFLDVANIKKHVHYNTESENRKLIQFTTFKKNGSNNNQNDAMKVNRDFLVHSDLQQTKRDTSRKIENEIGVQSSHATLVNMLHASYSETASSSGQKGQQIERKTLPNNLANGFHEQLKFAYNTEAKNTQDSAHIHIDSLISRNTQSVVHNEEVKDVSKKSVVQSASRSKESPTNCDYDSQETFQTPGSASPNEHLASLLHSPEITSYHVGINHQVIQEDTPNVYSQRCFPVSYNHSPLVVSVPEETEVQTAMVNSIHDTLSYQLPTQSLTSCSAELQYHIVTPSEDYTEAQSPEQNIRHISRKASSDIDPAESPMSSSDMTSPASHGSIWSASDGDFSPGVVSLSSMDAFSDTSLGELQSSFHKSPFGYARLEIVEALKWLRAAGFPQYAQMFEEGQFPVDLGIIERDHDFLDQDSLRSLFRRLEKLNKYAGLSLDTLPGKKAAKEEEDEEDLCALSDRWEYRKSARRWSRKGVTSSAGQATVMGSDPTEVTRRSDSHDSLLDQDTDNAMEESAVSEVKCHSMEQNGSRHVPTDKHPENISRRQDLNDGLITTSPIPVIPAGSEKNKSSQNVFKKMEVTKNKRSRGMSKRRNIVDISGPIVEDSEQLRAKLERLNCVDISPTVKTSRRQNSVGGKTSNTRTAAASADRKSNQRYSELSSSHISVHSGPNSHTPVQSPVTNCISVQSATNSHTTVQSPSASHISVQSTPNRQTLVQSGSTNHVSVHCPSSSRLPVHSKPTSHTPVQSPGSSCISLQSPASIHTLKQSSVYSTSKATLSTHESRPTETISQTTPHSGILKQSLIHSRNISSASQTPVERDSKLESRNQTAEKHSTNLLLVQTASLENAINSLGIKDVTPRSEEYHQPGRFPRILQNGYTETECRSAGSDDRNNTSQYSNTYAVAAPKSYSSGLRHRNSIYDNIQSDGKPEGQETARMIFPGIYELKDTDSGINSKDCSDKLMTRNVTSSVVVRHDAFTHDFKPEHNQPDPGTVSSDASNVSSSDGSCEKTYGSSVYNRSVSLETSNFESTGDRTARTEAGVSNSQARNDTKTSADSPVSKSKGVVHSSSLDSYFQGSNEDFGLTGTASRDSTQRMIPQKEYDDFDAILQQLYQNINELSDYVSRDTVNPISPSDVNTSLEFDGVLDQDPENSFSGGEGSNTGESSSEDPEVNANNVSRDSLDQIPSVSRERRDSGVGHSLPRAPSERRQKKLRWNSFQNSHKPDVNCRAMQINHLTVYQMVRLQKLCLLKLTAIMEKCLPVSRSGWNWMMPRFMKKHKTQDFIDRKVFGVPLSVIAQRTGQPLPQCVLYAMRYLRRTSPNAVGIFRKSGVKSKIQQLRDYLESHPDTVDFEEVNAYSVADVLKTYFRDLPECLLTNKMSEIFRSIYLHVPPAQRLEALQTAIVLLPDENREVLQSILLFLSDISSHEADHQMNANNLAVCFTPTVFQLVPQQTPTQSPKRTHKTYIAVPDPREMMEQKAAHECLLMMILECKKLFTVFPSLYRQLQVHSATKVTPVPLLDIGRAPSDVRAFGQERIQIVLKEAHDKNRGWLQAFTVGYIEVFNRKPLDDCPLKEWKLIVEIEAPPIEVLHRILHERHLWDEDLVSWSVVERLDPHSDIFQFVLNSMAPHPFRHYCVLRYWRSDLNKGACALITKSVEHADPMEVQGVWAVDLGSYFLMEHCGSGRSRLTYITRLDTRGRSPEWYTRIFGHISANFLARLKESFKQVTLGPETRV